MKVLQINSVCGIRSTGRICTDISDILRQSGSETKIAYGREAVPDKYKDISYRIGNNISTYVDGLKTRLLDNAGFNSRAATRKFIAWVKQYNPDIIHLHNIHGYYINIEILFNFLKEYDRPVIWTLHDCWAFTGHCSYFTANKCEYWKNGCFKCPKKKEYPASLILDRSYENWERKKALFTGVKRLVCVTPSRWLAELVKESFLKEYEVTVIPNGIDLNSFKPTYGNFKKRLGIEDKKILLGVASVWDRRKGFDTFLKLSRLLNEDEIIVLVGLNKEQLKNLPENIIGIERTNSVNELAEIYTAADVFLNPTIEDNLPTVNFEALACGTPVITYETGGSPETISSSSGLSVKKGDITALLNAARSLSFNKQDILKAVSEFDKERRYYEYLALYNELHENSLNKYQVLGKI